jgi:predicted DCC family thiol-disulfide oxidoreductase YuxK
MGSATIPSNTAASASAAWPFTILIDGLCPLCKREGALLQRLDRGRGRLVLVDIASAGFDPSRYGRTMDEVMGSIHGVRGDGEVVSGMEVFRLAYAAVGMPWLLGWTRWPGLRWVADKGYSWFAANRLRLTGRGAECEGGRCSVGRVAGTER